MSITVESLIEFRRLANLLSPDALRRVLSRSPEFARAAKSTAVLVDQLFGGANEEILNTLGQYLPLRAPVTERAIGLAAWRWAAEANTIHRQISDYLSSRQGTRNKTTGL